MNKTIVVFVMIALVPLFSTTVSAGSTFKTGYELYNAIQVSDKIQTSADYKNASEKDILTTYNLITFIDGFVDGLALMQDTMMMMLVPTQGLTSSQIADYKEMINLRRLGIPKDGLAVGQVIMIYKKWAGEHPEDLNQSARACLMMALIKAYGWEKV
jgi:hypothetical protein